MSKAAENIVSNNTKLAFASMAFRSDCHSHPSLSDTGQSNLSNSACHLVTNNGAATSSSMDCTNNGCDTNSLSKSMDMPMETDNKNFLTDTTTEFHGDTSSENFIDEENGESDCDDNPDKNSLYVFVEAPLHMKAAVWHFFGFYKIKGSCETRFDRTLCKFCNNLLAYNTGCTTGMRQHLRTHGVTNAFLGKLRPRGPVEGIEPNQSAVVSAERKNSDCNQYEFVPPHSDLKAPVWEYFGFYKEKGSDTIMYDKTWCNLCDQLFVYVNGNTSTMVRHLERHHSNSAPQFSSSTSTCPTSTVASNAEKVNKKRFCHDVSNFEIVDAKPSLKALVWRYFGFYKVQGSEETKFDYTCCKLCRVRFKYSTGCTTTMRSHLLRVHNIHLKSLYSAPQSQRGEPSLDKNGTKMQEIQTVREFKKLFRGQCCTNQNCNRPISLEPDGSPPQFCAGCGLFLSHILSEIWSVFPLCCKLCGKIKSPTEDVSFCTRCGSYISTEVEVFSHESNSVETRSAKVELKPLQKDQKSIQVHNGAEIECFDADTDFDENGEENTEKQDGSNQNESTAKRNRFQCELCSYQSISQRRLNTHIRTAHRFTSKSQAFDCDVCHYKTNDWDDFTEHASVHLEHSTELKKLTEEVASTVDGNQEDRQKSTEADSDSDTVQTDDGLSDGQVTEPKKLLVRHCKTCNQEFKSLFELKCHKRQATCTPTMLTCDECDFMTSKLDSMRGHKRRNHGNITLKKCSYCDRLFKLQRNLDEHINTHTGATPFQCDKCGKAFHTNSSWYKHKRNNCKRGPRDKKLCSHCGKAVFNLGKHISDVHFNIKQFTCGTCQKSFGTQYHLERHVRIHTGEKPYPCKYCEYRAAQKVVTDGHMKKCKYRPSDTDPSHHADPSSLE